MKRTFDMAFALTGLIVTAPLWLVIPLLVKVEDGGPVFFSQGRVGLNGRVFNALKFRSMIRDAEKLTGPVQATAGDPRMTRVGRWLRATAFDELPQLLNILRGEMSVVGPRPLRPGEKDVTADGAVELCSVPGYEERHRIRPGLTGLAQVYARRDLPRDQKFRYDLAYVKGAGLWVDVKLIVLSLWVTLRGKWEV